MDKNLIDIKIREFAIYLKELGILNETNIKDFLITFKNITGKDFCESNNFNNNINLELIYLKENLSKAMFEFFNLMMEERKRITYLNIYSKFLQKREKDLKDKGFILFKLYCFLIIKKYFAFWKSLIPYNDINNKKAFVPENFKNLKTDNFCFDIISDNNSNVNNNLIINSNNHKIIFNSNNNSKNDIRSTINSYTDINSLILSTKSTIFNNNNNLILNSNYSKNKNFQDNKQSKKINPNFKINCKQNNIIFENFEQQNKTDKKEIKKQNQINNKSQSIKNSNLKNDEKNKNKNKTINNDEDKAKKRKKNFIKLIEKNKINICENNLQTIRRTYNHKSPINNFNYDEYNKKNVYKRLYEQNIKYNKRKKQKMEENLKEIKERTNHPLIKSSSVNKFKNIKKSFDSKDNIKQNKILKTNILDNKKIDKNDIEKHFIFEKEYRYTAFNNNSKKETEVNIQDNHKLNEYKTKFIELYNDIIKKEENKIGKKYNEKEKDKMLRDLLNNIYQEKYQSQNSDDNTNEFSKTVEEI